jgi:PBP1b-binding outer membrane lipoprotein LpoB
VRVVLALFLGTMLMGGCVKSEAPKSAQQSTALSQMSSSQEKQAAPTEQEAAVNLTSPEQLQESSKAISQDIAKALPLANQEEGWGFSVFTPETGKIDYYSSSGALISRKQG